MRGESGFVVIVDLARLLSGNDAAMLGAARAARDPVAEEACNDDDGPGGTGRQRRVRQAQPSATSTRLARFISGYSGIKMPPNKITMVEGRLRRRLRAAPASPAWMTIALSCSMEAASSRKAST